jgi:hypothetical protein
MPRLLFASAFCSLIVVSTFEMRAAELVMLEAAGCSFCEQWNEEIGVVYDKTVEGRRLPLRRVDIHDPLPKDLAYLAKGGYTPTFIVVDKGREIGRIRGYPGEDFFWGLLGQLIKRLPPDETESRQIN